MPTYDYECKNCDHQVLDIRQSFDDDPLVKCPECKKNKLFRIVTGGIYLKVNNVDTIGKLADKNTKAMGGQLTEAAAKNAEENPAPKGEWFQDKKYGDATAKESNNMSVKQQTKYIREGKK
jgi:putative FmdB family regulatory protein